MRSALSVRRSLRFFLTAVALVAATTASHAQTTTFSGHVYSPLGATAGDPLPNILVFVKAPDDPSNPQPTELPVFSKGIAIPTGTQTGCEAQPSLVPARVLSSTTTDPTGSYSLNVTGALPDPVVIVIQAGKWRSVTTIPLNTINVGGANPYDFTMPSKTIPGASPSDPNIADLPSIAVVTGSADSIECIFPQIGIDSSEITDPTGTGHINFFLGTGKSGETISPNTPSETQLVDPSATYPMTNYDLVIFGCQGPSGLTDPDANNTADQDNLVNYANSGGRVFATHWEFSWVNYPSAWSALSSFSSSSSTANATETGTLATTGNFYTGEPTLAAWLADINAFEGNPANLQISLTHVFANNVLAVNPPAQDWIDVNVPPYGKTSNQFSFDTPIGAAGTPAASLSFTNITNTGTTFLTGDPADKIAVTVTNTSQTPTSPSPGLQLTLSIPTQLSVTSIGDSSGGSFSCTLTSGSAVCTLPVALAPGASDTVTLTFSIPQSAPLGTYNLIGTLSNGGINQSQQCGRVLYNDYHVENGSNYQKQWDPVSCGTGNLLNVQKFLEYSLYNLSNFVAPANTDTIQIQASSVIDWTVPTPTYYGTLLSQIETASSITPGALTYTFTPTNSNDPIDAADYTFIANFAPTDSVDYLKSSQTKSVPILADPTDSFIDLLDTSIYYGEEIGYNNGVDATLNVDVEPNLPNLLATPTVIGGIYNLTIDGTSACTGTVGTPITGGSRPGACPDSGFLGWNAGSHSLVLTYAGTTDFSPSNSNYTVTINPDPTATTLATSGNGTSIIGSIVTDTATVADTYTTAIGTITFYDSTTPVAPGLTTPPGGVTTLSSSATVNGAASASLASLPIGTHNIFACFVAPNQSSGEPNMAPSCSGSTPQVVNAIPVSPEGTAALLRSSANPSPFGNPVSFTATIESTGAITTIPTGTVTFNDAGAAIGTASLDPNGTAVLTTSTLAVGTHPITVTYAGTASLDPSTSATLNEVIVTPGVTPDTGFLLKVTPTLMPVFVGSTATGTVQIIPLTNFDEPVTLTCSGLPAQASCTFAQSIIPAGGGSTQVFISAGAPHNCNSTTPYFASFSSRGGLALMALAALTLCFLRRRRMLQAIALMVLLIALPATLTGCGTACTNFAVKPGDYNFMITATAPAGTSTPTATTKTQAMIMHATLQ